MAMKQVEELKARGIAIACPCYPPKEQYEVTVFSYDEIVKWLLAHETHAKEMLEEQKGDDCYLETECRHSAYWRGRLEAIQALRSKKRESLI